MVGLQGQSLPQIFSVVVVLVVGVVVAENLTTLKQEDNVEINRAPSHSDLSSEEFLKWLQEQERRVVLKIMEKIASPNDTSMQHAAKIAVAKYLVNVTFTAMTRRLETLKRGKALVSETLELPASALPVTTTELVIMMSRNNTGNQTLLHNATLLSEEKVTETLVFREKGENSGGNDTSLPSSPGIYQELPLSSTLKVQSTTSATMNETETTTTSTRKNRPIWEELLTFNFSAALMGGEGAGNLLSSLSGGEGGGLLNRLGGGGAGNEGGGFLSRLNLTALGGGDNGGNLFDRLNLTALGGGGDGGNLFERLNLTSLGGGGGGNLFDRLNLTSLGSGGGNRGSLFGGLNLTALGGGGGQSPIFTHFSALRPTGGNNTNETRPNLPFNLPPPPEGLFNYPTPPPMNDSVRMSQMLLGSQVEKLMGDINKSNLTGIVESTINIATPSTVGVLVNALLNIVLCNPLDRFHGYCGVE